MDKIKTHAKSQNVTELLRFLGFRNLYRKYVHNNAKIAAPLNELLKKDVSFLWKDACEEAFQVIKQAFIPY